MVTELNATKKKLASLEKRFDEIVKDYTEIKQSIGARQLALRTDQKAMKFIFPKCQVKPYCLRSYKNLLSFVSNPLSDEFTGPLAPQAWLNFSLSDKLGIEERIKTIRGHYEYLAVYIKDLKTDGDLLAHKATSVEQLKEFFVSEPNDALLEAGDGCNQFLLADLSL